MRTITQWTFDIADNVLFQRIRYNFPMHTGNLISPALFKRLTHDFPLVRGIKNVRPSLFLIVVELMVFGFCMTR